VKENPTPAPEFLTVRQFSKRFPAFSEGALRALIFDSEPRYRIVAVRRVEIPANGFGPAFLRVGRRVLIDPQKFFEIIRDRNAPRNAERSRRVGGRR